MSIFKNWLHYNLSALALLVSISNPCSFPVRGRSLCPLLQDKVWAQEHMHLSHLSHFKMMWESIGLAERVVIGTDVTYPSPDGCWPLTQNYSISSLALAAG